MSGPQDQRVGLEAETEGSPLYLDLWKGFSAPIKFTLVTVDEDAERNDQNWYRFPHFVADGDDDARVHFARALSHGLLVIKDANERLIQFDHTADNDTWSRDGDLVLYHDLYNDEQREKYLFPETASLLRLFRKNLIPGLQYSLELATANLTVFWGNDGWHRDKSISAEQISNGLPLQFPCDQSPISFRVIQGVEVPCFTVSLSSTSSTCSTAGGDGFEICLSITSQARVPIMLGLVDGKWYRDTDLAAGWSCNGFWSLWRLFLKESIIDGYFEDRDFDIWGWHGGRYLTGGLPSVHLTPGSYRRHIEAQSNTDTPIPCLSPSPPPPNQEINHPGRSRAMMATKPSEAVILCPGDRITQIYSIPQTHLDLLHPHAIYQLKLKNMFCKFWKAVSDTEVQQSSIRVPSPPIWPENGPIHFEIVSEVASILRCIFEREKPRFLFRLPLELREEVYGYLRFKERARYTDFVAKP